MRKRIIVSIATLVGCLPASRIDGELAMEEPAVAEPAELGTVDAGPGSAPGVPTWWQDIKPIVSRECHLCHGAVPQFGAPMPLAEYEDVIVASRILPDHSVHHRIAARVQRTSGLPPMPPVSTGALTDEEIIKIYVWSKNGAPEGARPSEPPEAPAPHCDAGVGSPGEEDGGTLPEDPEPDPEEPFVEIEVLAPRAAIRPDEQDYYGCFRTVVQTNEPLHAVQITPTLDDLSVLHHILLFRDGGRNYPESRTGFLCAADTVLQDDWELLHGWAPGGPPMVLPPEAGVRLEDGDHLVVQIHYNNYGDQMVLDSSGMTLKATARLRPNDAAMLGVGTESFTLPPGEPSVSESGECPLSEPMHIFSYTPHMHLLGKAATLERIRGGTTTTLGQVPAFAFESQLAYETNIDLLPGDTLKATCTWDTTTRTTPTGFGEGTEDEMCYVFVAHYPPFGDYSCGD